MQIYANLFKINEKCYFSVISWPILILFVLSDRAWCGLQNYLHRILKFMPLCKYMQIYSNSMKNATRSPLFSFINTTDWSCSHSVWIGSFYASNLHSIYLPFRRQRRTSLNTSRRSWKPCAHPSSPSSIRPLVMLVAEQVQMQVECPVECLVVCLAVCPMGSLAMPQVAETPVQAVAQPSRRLTKWRSMWRLCQ